MIQVPPGSVAGRLRAPASKSHLQRLLLAASLAPGTSLIRQPGSSADGVACLGVIRDLGAGVKVAGDVLEIRGGGRAGTGSLDCGESGFCLRAAAAVAALQDLPVTLSGHGSLLTRPMEMVLDPLRQLGVACSTREGLPPITVRGPLKGGQARVDGRASSQFLSGLLLALPRAPGDSRVEVEGLRSGPYIRMTLDVLEAFGVSVEASPALDLFRVPGGQTYRPVDVAVEGDWSGAAFLLVAGAVAGDVAVEGLNPASAQADRAILRALEEAGAAPAWEGGTLRQRRADLRGFTFDATDCPDLFPPLAALACHAGGLTRLKGASRLKAKESDRATALVKELSAMGARLRVEGDWMEIEGGPLEGGAIDPHNDHRMAMACAVAGLRSARGAAMEGEACVDKSYPGFFNDLASLRGGA
ncbi:3-phosphoshikimate 1-carboxyvinyltransferase [Mesoterricola silvestris]|uniref:3-phosphoshikimate 1-carboxyvinyltransferase n=1 Tax=Mesoterricola silvestris TaxID=2927979 RepID=A0AA48GL91_9BACT|nr:3-phosphoshikimate 1-carboxyvinyltransferase [Mesoterricola silvestris]BDU73329.1 3-phosphoshikimate 1-carboxyvinyltransferase [Mesoterricola silvestris]